jgi:hypothetical protein
MRYWIIVLLLFVGAAHSQVIDKNDPGYIQVMGTGKTLPEAKQNGFKNAISMRVGLALLTENQVANNKLIKENIIDYSAGYIDSYNIVDVVVRPDSVVVIMQVVVKSSKIHERILNRGKDEKDLSGDKLANQYLTYLEQTKNGDKVLNAVLNDYPSRSFKLTQGAHEFKLNAYRVAVLVIPFELRWSRPFLVSLHEVAKLLQDGGYNAPSRVKIGHSIYNFNDYAKYEQVRQRLNSEAQMRVDMIDSSNRIIATRCFMVPTTFSGTYSTGTYVVYEFDVLKNTVQIEVDHDMASMLARVTRTDLSIASTCSNL